MWVSCWHMLSYICYRKFCLWYYSSSAMDIVNTNLAERYISSVLLFCHGPLLFFWEFSDQMVGTQQEHWQVPSTVPDEVHAVGSSSSEVPMTCSLSTRSLDMYFMPLSLRMGESAFIFWNIENSPHPLTPPPLPPPPLSAPPCPYPHNLHSLCRVG